MDNANEHHELLPMFTLLARPGLVGYCGVWKSFIYHTKVSWIADLLPWYKANLITSRSQVCKRYLFFFVRYTSLTWLACSVTESLQYGRVGDWLSKICSLLGRAFCSIGITGCGSWFVNRLVVWLVDSRLISSLLAEWWANCSLTADWLNDSLDLVDLRSGLNVYSSSCLAGWLASRLANYDTP